MLSPAVAPLVPLRFDAAELDFRRVCFVDSVVPAKAQSSRETGKALESRVRSSKAEGSKAGLITRMST